MPVTNQVHLGEIPGVNSRDKGREEDESEVGANSSDEISLGLSSGSEDELALIEDEDDEGEEDEEEEGTNKAKRPTRARKPATSTYQDDLLDGIDFQLSDDSLDDLDGQVLFTSSSDEYQDDEEAEDDLDENYDFKEALRLAGNFRSKKKKNVKTKSYWKRKMMRTTNRELDPEVRMHLSQANEAFVRQDFQLALNSYLEVIKKDPKNFNAYKTLGEIYKSQGRLHECCNYWLLAANIHPWDSQFWSNVAELSSELGYIDQAIYCYTRAISADSNKRPEFILERAILYKEKKQYGRALEGFQKIHSLFPTDSNIIKNLASVYLEQKRVNDAINLYMSILDQNMRPSESTESQVPSFDWAELNILCELYLSQHAYVVGIKILKLVARWLQDRSDEKWWDEQDNDIEFDRRRFTVIKQRSATDQEAAQDKEFDLPIDIRFKLGVLRLGLDQKEEAMFHFDYLRDEEEIADLLFEAGKALEAQGYNEDAIEFLNKAYDDEEQRSTELLELMGKCNLEMGEYQQAKEIYTSLAEVLPESLDIKLALIEALYHLGDVEEAGVLLERVSAMAKDTEKEGIKDTLGDDEEPLPLINNTQLIRSARSAKLTEDERIDIENNAKRRVLEKFHRMQRLQPAIDTHDRVAVMAWIKLAAQLVEMFMSVRSFFPRDKNRLFKGIILYKRKKQMGINDKLARVYNLYEGMTAPDNIRHELTSVTEYRGLSYDEWFFIFVQYAILLHQYEENIEIAIQTIEIAQGVSVFVQDKKKSNIMKLIRLMFSINQDDATGIAVHVRHFLSVNQFSPFMYKFFMCCFSSGSKRWASYTSYLHQKFFLRQVKAFDSILKNTKITGMATITADVKNVNLKKDNLEVLYTYATLFGGSRSHVSEVIYANRAYQSYHQDPTVCLILGISHVHRSMQRLSTNRHLQLLQGISYLLEYRSHRLANATDYERQEVEFNFGRLFQMIGLPSLAVKFYDKVLSFHDKLEDSTYDLLMEAAHNLSLIYTISGNTALAREITVKYLTI